MDITETKYGKLEGIRREGCIQYLGIPFAKPPVGDLAFRHPEPPEAWEGVFKADRLSKNPIQDQHGWATGNNSQDCLYLNVFVPEGASKKLPVMVWIYGGSYNHGGVGEEHEGAGDYAYNLARLAVESNTVMVEFNYRLNLYGFLNLHFLSDRFDSNCGLYDQIMALQYVHDNIGAFGGDPDNVTVFGQSAGGACVLALMSMEDAIPLFHKGIAMSPCAEHFWTEEKSRKLTKRYLKYLGIKTNELEKLFSIDEDRVRAANRMLAKSLMHRADIRCAFSPVIDGVTLKDAPVKLAQKSNKPLLIGSVKEESNYHIRIAPTWLLPIFGKILGMKPIKGNAPYRERFARGLDIHIYRGPIKEIADNYTGNVWVYEYHYMTEDIKNQGYGCYHVCDLSVLFGQDSFITRVHDPETDRVGKQMRELWGNFARSGECEWERSFANPHIIK